MRKNGGNKGSGDGVSCAQDRFRCFCAFLDSFLRPLLSFHHFVARARVFVIPNRTTHHHHHHHHAAAKQKRKENSQILVKKERKKERIKQTDKRERKRERKKREQSYCEPAAPRPGSRVSNRYHRSVGKNQSPGAFVVVGFVFRRALPSLTVNILLP